MELRPEKPDEWALYEAITNAWSVCLWNTEAYGYIAEAKMIADGIDPAVAKREGHWPPYRPPQKRRWLLRLQKRGT